MLLTSSLHTSVLAAVNVTSAFLSPVNHNENKKYFLLNVLIISNPGVYSTIIIIIDHTLPLHLTASLFTLLFLDMSAF